MALETERDRVKASMLRVEQQLENAAAGLQGIMPILAEHAWDQQGILGLVSELLRIEDPQLRGVISRYLGSQAGQLLLQDAATVNVIKDLHARRTLRRQVDVLEVERFQQGPSAPQILPHRQRNNLKGLQDARYTYFEATNRIRYLADLLKFEDSLVFLRRSATS